MPGPLKVTPLRPYAGIDIFRFDDIGKIVVQAPSQVSLTATFTGRASHSGIAPEHGRSAIRALTFGREPRRIPAPGER